MFAQVDSLPGSQAKFSATDRDRDRTAKHRCLDVRGHVIRPLARVNIRKIFRGNRVKRRFQVSGHIGVGIFVDGQRCRGVLDENMEQPDLD